MLRSPSFQLLFSRGKKVVQIYFWFPRRTLTAEKHIYLNLVWRK